MRAFFASAASFLPSSPAPSSRPTPPSPSPQGVFSTAQDTCQALTVTYTTTAEFNGGVLNGAVAVGDQVELTPLSSTWPYAWIANSNDGTISKVDTQTGKEVGRYYTGPPIGNDYAYLQPSRTVVDRNGNCWVANRPFADATMIQIATTGGEDRNNNSIIETSMDANNNGVIDPFEILPWGQDERVLRHYVVQPADQIRGLVIDKNGFLWVGLSAATMVAKVDPNLPTSIYAPNLTPTLVPHLATATTAQSPYGLALSPNGNIYVATGGEYAFEINTGSATVTETIFHPGNWNYGIAVDQNCIVWLANTVPPYGCIRWDPTQTVGNPALGWTLSGLGAPGVGRGITVDFNNDIWMACNDTLDSVVKFSNTPTPTVIGVYPTPSQAMVGVGVAIDGNIIAVPGGNSLWTKLDVNTGNIIVTGGPQLVGMAPYSYSDFTGSLQNMVGNQQGIWSRITDGGYGQIVWNYVAWNGNTPGTTSLSVEARVAPTLSALSSTNWSVVASSGFLGTPIPGRYIETRVKLDRFVECGQPFVTPELYDLTVAAICDSCSFVSCPEDTIIPCQFLEGAEFFYSAPQLSSLCDSTYVVTCSPPGGFFPMGTTAVNCIAVNAANDTLRCTFSVTVSGDCDPDLEGACCVGESCYQATQAGCQSAGGVYHGDNTSCTEGCSPNCAEPPNNLVGWWPLDGAAGTVTPNRAGVATGGVLQNGPALWTGSYVNNAYTFNGINQSIHVPHHASLDLGGGDFSADFWVNTASQPGVATLLDKRSAGTVQGIVVFLYNGYPGVQLGVAGGFDNYILTNANSGAAGFVGDSQWHLVAVTVDRDNPNGVQFYVDGNPVGPTFNPTPRQGNLNNTEPLYMARPHPTWGGGYYAGALDEIELTRRVLRPEEIDAIHQAGASGKCPEVCFATQGVPCCGGYIATSSITICNYGLTAHLYSWGVSPATGPGCTGVGPSGYSPPSGSVVVPAQSCVTVPINIACPSNIPVGATACYEVNVFNHDTGRTFSCLGSVRRPLRWCLKWIDVGIGVDLGGITGIPTGTARALGIEVTLPAGSPADVLNYSIEALEPHEDISSVAVSLNGEPAGVPATGSLAFAPGETKMIPLDVAYDAHYPIGYDRLRFLADDTGDGTPENLGAVAVRSEDASITSVTPPDDGGAPQPNRLILAFPNPFAASNQIRFQVTGNRAKQVFLALFDLQGRQVKTLLDGAPYEPGKHSVAWDTRDDQGVPLVSGIYFLRLQVDSTVESGKVLIRR